MKKFTVLLFTIIIFSAFVNNAYAVLNLEWWLDSPVITVEPTDTIDVFATLHNDISSTESLDLNTIVTAGYGYQPGSLINTWFFPTNPYDIEIHIGPLDFSSVNLSPGDSYNFLFATLTPMNSPVDIGSYWSSFTNINFATPDYPDKIYFDFGEYKPLTVNVVPEPISSTLFIVGGAVLGFRGFRKRGIK